MQNLDKFKTELNKGSFSKSAVFNKVELNNIEFPKNTIIEKNVEIYSSDIYDNEIKIGENVVIKENSLLVFDKLKIEDSVIIGQNSKIRAGEIFIGKNATIDENFNVLCSEKFSIGKNSNVGKNITVQCRTFEAGDFLQFYEGALVGKGGKFGVNARVKVGSGCFIGKYTLINPSENVEIGDDVGLGDEVQVWTHGGYLSTLDGFPVTFAPVRIGNHVWLPARSIVLPGVSIGDNVVIGINSLVNKDIPSGCLAAGIPCKVIKENIFPKKLVGEKRARFIDEVIARYLPLMKDKGIDAKIKYDLEDDQIIFKRTTGETMFNLRKMEIIGICDDEVEDFRDFLRRNGIKFFTENRFRSIIPPAFERLMRV
jgi:acetyltransferase-like isoleucine patch superfamily enzyme